MFKTNLLFTYLNLTTYVNSQASDVSTKKLYLLNNNINNK